MALDSVHPLYAEHHPDWVMMRDFYKGESVVKGKREAYLPATQGMQIDGMSAGEMGLSAYNAYLLRAVFPDYVKEAVEAYIGTLHLKPPTVTLPAVMEPLRERATSYGEPMNLLLRRMNEEQLVTGRVGLLLDLPINPDPAKPLPYIALYTAESIRNWDDGEIEEGPSRLNLVVLDESGNKRQANFDWKRVAKYRVLQLGMIQANEAEGTAQATYQYGVFENETGTSAQYNEAALKTPAIRGTTLPKIPFVFTNSKDIIPEPDQPPLMGLARLCGAIYRGEADYRQNLFMQGQDTLVLIGEQTGRQVSAESEASSQPLRTGAGSMINVEAGGDAKYIGVDSQGLPEQRIALENDRTRAESKSGVLATNKGSQAESGEALKIRVAAATATLVQIALTGAAALEAILRICAEWMGANPDEVKVTPNIEFSDFDMTGKNLVDLMTARNMGAPISRESIHALLVDRGMTKLPYQDEIDKIDEENLSMPQLGTDVGGNPPAGNAA